MSGILHSHAHTNAPVRFHVSKTLHPCYPFLFCSPTWDVNVILVHHSNARCFLAAAILCWCLSALSLENLRVCM